jgi:thiopurine S-methyltransferase
MEISYWQSRWQKDKTGWHMDMVYPQLIELWPQNFAKEDTTVLIPLCGKSLDIQWFIQQGYHVIGVDVSYKALKTVRDRSAETFTAEQSHGFSVYRSNSLELWEGNFMDLPISKIPRPHIIYDKASIIALPPKMRSIYAQKVLSFCTPSTEIFLQTFEYRQEEMHGPPFSVDDTEIQQYFGDRFNLSLMHEQPKLEELNGFKRRGLKSYLTEKVFHLTPKHQD